MTKISRNFVLTSLAVILMAAVCLTFFYRYVALQALARDSEADNEVRASDFAKILSPELADFLASAADGQHSQRGHPFSNPLAISISKLLERKDVQKIEIYDKQGDVVYSSDPSELVTAQSTDNGVRAALAGKAANEFVYEGGFSRIHSAMARKGFVHSYIPVTLPGEARAIGVFELTSDTTQVIDSIETLVMQIMFGGLLGFSLLAGVLVAAARRTGNVMESEKQAVENDKQNLSQAGMHVLNAEASDRERIAGDLESGAVQSLCAVKLMIEAAIAKAEKGKLPANDPVLVSVIPVMREAIASLSLLATEIHPTSLRDLGLVPALSRACDEFRRAHPSIVVEQAFEFSESDIPQNLRSTVYRVVQSILENVGRHAGHDRVKASLAVEQQRFELRVDLRRSGTADESSSSAAERTRVLAGMEQARERVILSGGTFSAHADSAGQVNLCATWLLEPG